MRRTDDSARRHAFAPPRLADAQRGRLRGVGRTVRTARRRGRLAAVHRLRAPRRRPRREPRSQPRCRAPSGSRSRRAAASKRLRRSRRRRARAAASPSSAPRRPRQRRPSSAVWISSAAAARPQGWPPRSSATATSSAGRGCCSRSRRTPATCSNARCKRPAPSARAATSIEPWRRRRPSRGARCRPCMWIMSCSRALRPSRASCTRSTSTGRVNVYTIGPATTAAARGAGLAVTAEAREPSLEGILEAMQWRN